MKRIFSYTITAQDSDQRIYDFLCHHGYSRHIRTWLKQHPGSVRLNAKEALFYFPLKTGDLLEITLEEEQPSENIIPVCLPLHIIYEDEDLMVIDKPADMPVHPSIGNYENTLANAVAWYFQQQNIPFVFRCINRLDRDPTGLLILAKNMLSGAILSDQMKKREIHRIYLAITEGKTDPAGTINRPIGRADQSLILQRRSRLYSLSAKMLASENLLPGNSFCSTGWSFSGAVAAGNRTYPSDPCAYDFHRTSSDRRYSVQSGNCPAGSSGTTLLSAGIYPPCHRSSPGVYFIPPCRYGRIFPGISCVSIFMMS